MNNMAFNPNYTSKESAFLAAAMEDRWSFEGAVYQLNLFRNGVRDGRMHDMALVMLS